MVYQQPATIKTNLCFVVFVALVFGNHENRLFFGGSCSYGCTYNLGIPSTQYLAPSLPPLPWPPCPSRA